MSGRRGKRSNERTPSPSESNSDNSNNSVISVSDSDDEEDSALQVLNEHDHTCPCTACDALRDYDEDEDSDRRTIDISSSDSEPEQREDHETAQSQSQYIVEETKLEGDHKALFGGMKAIKTLTKLKPMCYWPEFTNSIGQDCWKQKIDIHFENDGLPGTDASAFQVGNIFLTLLDFSMADTFLETTTLSQKQFMSTISPEKDNCLFTRISLHVSEIPTRSVLCIVKCMRIGAAEEKGIQKVLNKEVHFCHVDLNDFPADLFKAFIGARSSFRLDVEGYDKEIHQLQLSAQLFEEHILPSDTNCIPSRNSKNNPVANLLNFFYGVRFTDMDGGCPERGSKKEDLTWFYGQLRKYQDSRPIPLIEAKNELLVSTLREYQVCAISWMLLREGCKPPTFTCNAPDLTGWILDHIFVPIELGVNSLNGEVREPGSGGCNAYLNKYAGYLVWDLPRIPNVKTGGILADEMGLGKTIEVLSLILLNPRTDQLENSDSSSSSSSSCSTPIFNNKRKLKEDRLEHLKLKRKRSLSPCEFETSATQINTPHSFPMGKTETGESLVEDDDDVESWIPRRKAKNNYRIDSDDEESSIDPMVTLEVCPGYGNGVQVDGSLAALQSSNPDSFVAPEYLENSSVNAADECHSKDAMPTHQQGNHENGVSEKVNEEDNVSLPPAKFEDISSGNESDCPPAIKHVSGKSKPKKTPKTQIQNTFTSKESTYMKVKPMYDAALEEYASAKYAQVTKKNLGRFFDSYVGPQAFFECICGDESGGVSEVVVCTSCGSSQHAECIRFKPDKHRNQSYSCPQCTSLGKPVESSTTLIVTPQTISHQWISEMKRHVVNKELRILFYKGVSRHGYIQPSQLASYDIVLTTYTVLSAELSHADLPHNNSREGRRFRNAKRFLPIPSPLISILWWRLCLDEAQMVEKSMSKVATMASRLHAIHKWCVTGTPINKGLDDLYGLLAFLGVHPLNDESWWTCLVSEPFHRKDFSFLKEIFGQLIWRTEKKHVLKQLGVPPQTEVIHPLVFSALEKHFYKRQFDTCGRSIMEKIAKLKLVNIKVKLSSLPREMLNSLLEPFLQLRQACVHPQMVRGESLNLGSDGRNLTMEELLSQLIKKTLLQCGDDQRIMISSSNGIASIFFILKNYPEAAKKYREVLQLVEKHKKHFQPDTLQLLHTLENLADIIDMNVSGVGFTLTDDTLRERADELRKKYLEKYEVAVAKTREIASRVTLGVETLIKENAQIKANPNTSWFLTILRLSCKLGKNHDLVQTVKDDLRMYASKRKTVGSMADRFNGIGGLEQVLIGKILEIESMRGTIGLSFEDLEKRDPSSLVIPAVHCHLRGQKPQRNGRKFMCNLCTYYEQFESYEGMLFAEEVVAKIIRTGRNRQKAQQGITTNEEFELDLLREEEELLQTTEHVSIFGTQKRTTYADSDTEKTLKIIFSFAKINKAPARVLEEAKLHLKIIEAMKKEFKVLRALWSNIYDQVSAFDELSQATTRLTLKDDNFAQEPQAGSSSSALSKQARRELKDNANDRNEKLQNIHLLSRHELDYKLHEMGGEYANAASKLDTHLGQFSYLESLKRGEGQLATETDECRICANELGDEWSVLVCGHFYCTECVHKFCPPNSQSFNCPHCICKTDIKSVTQVRRKKDEDEERNPSLPSTSTASQSGPPSDKRIRGSHSTKIGAMIAVLMDLQDSHPGEKVLVFSTWSDVLTIISKALDENDIKYLNFGSCVAKKFQAVLDKFKEREDVQVLLMPLSSGSKGLNIIEATHVFLVEPILNLANELQAVGRIHRIGQTRPTFVHRFYVQETIEEQLFNILKHQDISVDDEACLTVEDLKKMLTH